MRREPAITIDGIALTERQAWIVRNAVTGLHEQVRHMRDIRAATGPVSEEALRLSAEVLALMPDRETETLG